ncbi:MAG: outer membrane lipoprotein carrier protein LolA [Formosa sp.]|jgi:outer membrane lipoprotein-sorting protein|nr:outer membrane lipoprotein carrier protein LolA [Formosa sp.]MDC0382332.1 outer membrane lipoprotein carrier protein LolA [Flavobacteriaceae bacterium]MDC3350798.1 outer membrane lipoprotein carrier protein LolA [Flavobacteriaceae bacterium]|tara:strand:+ start:11035 stop:11679 length:645 start_codon:yes stop_codon:yes gene_type:complete
MRNYILILWTLFSFAGQAQSGDSEAQLLLNEVSAKVKSYRNLTLEFKYVLENTEENIRQETKGKVTIQGDKYVLNILGVTRIYDGESLFTISAEDEEVTISSNNTSDENTITPSELLNFYEDGYTYKLDIIQNVKGKKIQYVRLNPINSESEIKYVLLGIDNKTKHIHNLIEIGNNDTKTTLTINSFKTNQPISVMFFQFDIDKYSTYYINRLD